MRAGNSKPFEKLKMPYDDQLKQKIEREQRDLATRSAATLAARKLNGNDVYYLGLLYNLAGKFDGAFDAMQRFIRVPRRRRASRPRTRARSS